jgi:diamine N-acetyltransferase
MAANVELRKITQESVHAVLDLAVAPEQEQYVAPNARSIAEAHFEPRAWFRAVYADDDPVGFVMVFRDPPKDFYVWRFMIDADQQGKGYGRRALELLAEEARKDGTTEMRLSYQPGEHPARLLRAVRLHGDRRSRRGPKGHAASARLARRSRTLRWPRPEWWEPLTDSTKRARGSESGRRVTQVPAAMLEAAARILVGAAPPARARRGRVDPAPCCLSSTGAHACRNAETCEPEGPQVSTRRPSHRRATGVKQNCARP